METETWDIWRAISLLWALQVKGAVDNMIWQVEYYIKLID